MGGAFKPNNQKTLEQEIGKWYCIVPRGRVLSLVAAYESLDHIGSNICLINFAVPIDECFIYPTNTSSIQF